IISDEDNDLVLFEPIESLNTVDFIPFVDRQVNIGESIWICGNPAGLEDLLITGSIVSKESNAFLVSAPVFFGNSGGGVFNRNTELVGIVSQIRAFIDFRSSLVLSFGVIIDINTIEEFLRQLEEV
ncbi:MAG: S1 family peptidase, partial [Candidatus Asgardarchaeia archaeon]